MTRTNLINLLFPGLLLAGCFNPDTSHIVIICDSQNPCLDGSVNDSSNNDSGDGGDSGDMMSMDGCKADNANYLGPKVRACPGVFASGHASDLCATGWAICQNATGIDLSLCNALDGFYAASVPGYWISPNRKTPACSASTGTNPLFFGCGFLRSYAADNMAGSMCSGFSRSIDCGASPKVWGCTSPYDIGHASNSESMDGVLCCKP
jgi:hypothetical protein